MTNHLRELRTHMILSLTCTTQPYFLTMAGLLVLVLIGLFCWGWQLNTGLHVTGLNHSASWGIYIINFVFFIGLSHAGTLISAILRLTHSESRRPITRLAESITLVALLIGSAQIVLDLGHPQRLLNLIRFGRLESPLLWDIISVTCYFLASLIYLYLPLIPDLAILRDRLPANSSNWRRLLYRTLALGWQGSASQKARLEKAINFMAALILGIAITVHTVISWLFSMTLRPMWHSTIFGPYFVIGAIFSGIAAIILIMSIFRRVFRLEQYWRPAHFSLLGRVLLFMVCIWFYFIFTEHLTTFYGGILDEMEVLRLKLFGHYAGVFWGMLSCMFVALILLFLGRKRHAVLSTSLASVFVLVGMWLERYQIIAPTLARSEQIGYRMGFYQPTSIEWWLTLSSFAAFILITMIFVKVFPIISIWEMAEGQQSVARMRYRMMRYFPEGYLNGDREK